MLTSIVLTWNPPLTPNGAIIGYEVTYTYSNRTVTVNIAGQSTTFVISDVIRSTTVSNISVRALTRAGAGKATGLVDQTNTIGELPITVDPR